MAAAGVPAGQYNLLMQHAAIPLLLLFLVTTGSAQAPKTEAEADGYLGPVHSVKTIRTEYAVDGKVVTGPKVDREQSYDTLQRPVEVREGNFTVFYDWDGEHLGRMRAIFADDPSRNITTEYKRDSAGEVYETVITDKNGTRHEYEKKTGSGTTIMSRLADGPERSRKVSTRNGPDHDSITYGPDGQVERRALQHCDDVAHACITTFYKGAQLERTMVQTLDPETGRQVEMRMYDASGKPLQIAQRRADGSYQQAGDGNAVQSGKTWSTSDPRGRITEFFFDNGSFLEWHKIEYDDKDRVKSQTNFDRGHKVIGRRLYEYREDGFGNWTRKIDRQCDAANACRVLALTSREITYW